MNILRLGRASLCFATAAGSAAIAFTSSSPIRLIANTVFGAASKWAIGICLPESRKNLADRMSRIIFGAVPTFITTQIVLHNRSSFASFCEFYAFCGLGVQLQSCLTKHELPPEEGEALQDSQSFVSQEISEAMKALAIVGFSLGSFFTENSFLKILQGNLLGFFTASLGAQRLAQKVQEMLDQDPLEERRSTVFLQMVKEFILTSSTLLSPLALLPLFENLRTKTYQILAIGPSLGFFLTITQVFSRADLSDLEYRKSKVFQYASSLFGLGLYCAFKMEQASQSMESALEMIFTFGTFFLFFLSQERRNPLANYFRTEETVLGISAFYLHRLIELCRPLEGFSKGFSCLSSAFLGHALGIGLLRPCFFPQQDGLNPSIFFASNLFKYRTQ